MNTQKEVIKQYYEELIRGVREKSVDLKKLNFASDIKVTGSDMEMEGEESVSMAWAAFTHICNAITIEKQYFDENSACSIITCEPENGAPASRYVEQVRVKNGKINEINVIYDTAAWAKIIGKSPAAVE